MARMIPKAPHDFHGSAGEERLFRALRSLPDRITIIHSFRWVHPGNARALTRHLNVQGEGDFVLFDPARGLMVVEVKGGEVWCENGEWYQKNRQTGYVQKVYPETQASDTKHRIRLDVQEKVPGSDNLLFCHAVWFPDGAVDRARLPMNYHPNATFDAEDVAHPEAAIERAFDFWRSVSPSRRGVDANTAKAVFECLAPTLFIVPSVRQALDEREERLVQLTSEQARIIQFLDEQAHAAVLGAAGTGKTMLAIEKARRLALPTEPVLFMCYNAALHRHLEAHHAQPNVRYATFHGLARELMGSDGSLDEAVEALLEHLADDGPLDYDNLIVDEAQDFHPDWLEYLGLRFRHGTFYVFYDRYQVVQGERDIRWLEEIPCRLVLTRNCRNTDPIAKTAYRAGGLTVAPTLGLSGPQPTLHIAQNNTESKRILVTLVQTARERHKIQPQDIAVLSLETLDEGSPWHAIRLAGNPTAEYPTPNQVTVTTARKFKGLEATLIILVDVDFRRAVDDEWRKLLYVACSRARQGLQIITTTPEADLGEAIRALADTQKVRASWQALSRQLRLRIAQGGNVDPFNESRIG